jgi:hypothetical protein
VCEEEKKQIEEREKYVNRNKYWQKGIRETKPF